MLSKIEYNSVITKRCIIAAIRHFSVVLWKKVFTNLYGAATIVRSYNGSVNVSLEMNELSMNNKNDTSPFSLIFYIYKVLNG